MTDQALKDLIASNAIGIKELRESQKETDKQIKELRESQKETDKQIKELRESQKETDKQMKKTDEKLEKVAKQLGSIGNNQGDVAEEYFQNTLIKKPKLLGEKFDKILTNIKGNIKDIQDEYDIILLNDKTVAIIEIKYKVHLKDIEKLDKKVKTFKKLFPEYQHLKLYVGIAGFYVPQDIIDLALENGYFVLQRKGKVIESFTRELKVA